MAKLIVLALTFTALVVFASAHRTIITTTIENIDNDSPRSSKQDCSRRLQEEQFDQCQKYLQQDQSSNGVRNRKQQEEEVLQMCCQELENVDEQCQCEAVEKAFTQAQQQQQQEGGHFGSQQIRSLKQKAQNLPNKCNLQTRQCQIQPITTVINRPDRSSQQCRQQVQEERQLVNQCLSYLARQSSPYNKLRMSINRKDPQPEGLPECCQVLQKVDDECQCEAMKEVYRLAQNMQQQGSQQRGKQQQKQQMEKLQSLVENLPEQCNLEVEQCRIPSAMF